MEGFKDQKVEIKHFSKSQKIKTELEIFPAQNQILNLQLYKKRMKNNLNRSERLNK